METPKTLLEGIKFAQKLANASNDGEIQLFFHLQAIAESEVWKEESFYIGAKNLEHYKDKKFGALMHDLYNKSTTWYRNMGHILGMIYGKKLYLAHGHANMIAYMGFSPEHKKFVLKVAAKRPLANFHSILASAGMKGSRPVDTKKEEENTWKSKYEKLKKAYEELKKKYEKLKGE